MSTGLYTHTTRATGTILTAAIYNADHQNHVTNQNPSMTGGLSDSVGEMQGIVDPGGVGSESLAGSVAEELRRLRFVVDRIIGGAQWYAAPPTDITALDTALGALAAGTLTGAFALSGDLTPAQIVANTNDYAPTGHATAFQLRLATDAARNITGIAGGAAGRLLLLHNIGAFNITLVDASILSAAANRFSIGQDFILGPGAAILFKWNATTSLWVAVSFFAPPITAAEAQAGTSILPGIWTPERVNQAIVALNPLSSKLLHIQRQKSFGTAGSSITAGSWQTRVIDTVVTNEITGASLAANVMTLPIGVYWAEIEAAATMSIGGGGSGSSGKLKLRNTADSTNIMLGVNGGAFHSGTGIMALRGRFTLAAIKTVSLMTFLLSGVTWTEGAAVSDGSSPEIYADVKIWKVG